MVALGTQDDFGYAQEFISHDELGSEITFLWDPSFQTWSSFGVRANSQMALLSADLEGRSDLFYGFGDQEQEHVLSLIDDFS